MENIMLRMPKESEMFMAREDYSTYRDRLNQYFHYKCVGSFYSWTEVVLKIEKFIANEIIKSEIPFMDVFYGYDMDEICDLITYGADNINGIPEFDNTKYYYIPIRLKH